ncbi:MAG: hypothetical protein QOC99_1135 [Acidobacteriota bacterium]|nr:hypothetical protein [Acidobacteriota bacterium]
MPLPFRPRAREHGAPLRKRLRRAHSTTHSCALLLLPLLASFVLGGFVWAQTPGQLDSTVVMFKSKDCPDKDDFPGTTINVGGARAVSDAAKGGWAYIDLTPGDHMISGLQEPGNPHAKLASVRVLLGNVLIKEYAVSTSGTANITMDESLFGKTYARPVIEIITENDCARRSGDEKEEPAQEDRRVDVVLKSLECNKGSYKGYTIYMNDQKVEPDGDDLASNVPLKSGRYRVRISVPGYPGAKVASVSVYRPDQEVYLQKSADAVGELDDFTLEDDLWGGATSTKMPVIFLYMVGDCPASYEPPAQRLGAPPQIRVVAVEGQVTVFKDDHPEAESQAVKGSMIEDQQVVYTRPGARVELVASDKRLFILGGKTVVKFVIRKNPDGTWGITSDLRAAEQFTVRHVGYVKGGEGYEWKVLTPTATVTEKGTVYSVTYDENSKVTTVGVEQGQVTVTPANTTLKPFTLDEHKKADVSDSRVSAVVPYVMAEGQGGGLFDNTLLLVGVGIAGLLVVLILPVAAYLIYRALRRTPPHPAYAPAGREAGASPSARNAPASRRCPNQNCGHSTRAGKKFCPACGTTMR